MGLKSQDMDQDSYSSLEMAITDPSSCITPTTLKLKELIASGQIGKVLSSEFHAARWISDPSVSSALKYFFARKVGGNFVTIRFGHGEPVIKSDSR